MKRPFLLFLLLCGLLFLLAANRPAPASPPAPPQRRPTAPKIAPIPPEDPFDRYLTF